MCMEKYNINCIKMLHFISTVLRVLTGSETRVIKLIQGKVR